MRPYSMIFPTFWTGSTGKTLKKLGTDSQLLALYLMTSPHATLALGTGIYYLPISYICHDIGRPFEGASEGLRRALEGGLGGVCAYDFEHEFVWVKEMAKFQIGQLKKNDNRVVCIKKFFSNVPESLCFLREFFEKYAIQLCLEKGSPFEAPSKPLTHPLRSQELEQELDQDQEQNLSQILLSNDVVVRRHNVESNDEECGFPLVLDTSTGEVIESGTFENGIPRIEANAPKIDNGQIGSIVQIGHVQNGSKVVQKDKKDKKSKNGQNSLNFDLFWKAYPYKQKKKYSIDIWKRKKLDLYIDIILEDLAQRTDWNAGSQFTPLPSSYLNGERWQDEEKNERKKIREKSYIEELEEEERLQELQKQKQMEKDNEN